MIKHDAKHSAQKQTTRKFKYLECLCSVLLHMLCSWWSRQTQLQARTSKQSAQFLTSLAYS